MTSNAQNEYEQLFSAYLKVCNHALENNKDVFPYKEICGATEKLLGDTAVKMAVYDDRPKTCYRVQMDDNKMQASESENPDDAKDAWRLNYSYLKQVVDNPEEYVKHPAKLDWDWLRNRLGL